jgi:hypothetical protein
MTTDIAKVYVVIVPEVFKKPGVPMSPPIIGEISLNDYRDERVLAKTLRRMANQIEQGTFFQGVTFKP